MLAACLGGLGFGLLSGFLKMLAPIVLLAIGIWLSSAVSSAIGPRLPEFLNGEPSQTAIVFLLVFVALFAVSVKVSFLLGLAMTAATTAVSVTPMGALLNRAGGAVAGLIYGCVLLSVCLIALQQIPVDAVASAIGESSFARSPMAWVDRFIPSIELAPD